MDSIVAHWTQAPNWVKIATFMALPTAGFLTARIYDDYQEWLKMGPGGLSYNFRGYILNNIGAAFFARNDTKSLSLYERPEKFEPKWSKASAEDKTHAQEGFLRDGLPERKGPTSKAINYTAPQRERNKNDYISPELQETYSEAYRKLAEKHSDAIKIDVSKIEGYGDAFYLKETYGVPTLMSQAKGEISHVHESDLSAHVILSYADAKEVIAKGWGERHKASGILIPLGYTMLYTPRNNEEADVLVKVFEAGVEYAKRAGRKT